MSCFGEGTNGTPIAMYGCLPHFVAATKKLKGTKDMSNPVYGRGANGRALRKDGTERKERRTLTPAERIAALADAQKKVNASIGRSIFGSIPGMAKFVSGIGTFRRWIRDARSYATAEARAVRREYYQRMLDTIDAKGAAAEAWLPKAEKAVSLISGLYQNIGQEITAFMDKNGREPTAEETEEFVTKYLSDDVRKIVEDSNNPENDVFHGFRRGDSDGAEDTEDDETLAE